MFEIFIEGFNDHPIITSIITLCLVVIIGLLGLLVWYCIDALFLPNNQGEGRILSKKFTPAHTEIMLIYNAATKTSLPTPIYHEDKWEIEVQINSLNGTLEISKEQFHKLSNGDTAKFIYSYGRISSGLYIKECLI